MTLLALLLGAALAAPGATPEPPPPERATSEARSAEVDRLRRELQRHAQRNQWKGVERTFRQLESLGPVPVDEMALGAQAALQLGDVWSGYVRWMRVARADPDAGAAAELERIRREFGRLTVRRVEPTPIRLHTELAPFRPDLRLSIDFARDQLDKTGAFDGMLPPGDYTVGPYAVHIRAELTPVLIQRVPGDGPRVP